MKHHENSVMDRAITAIIAQSKVNQENAGKEFYRHEYDLALHIYTALKSAGLKVVRDRQYTPPAKTLVEVLT